MVLDKFLCHATGYIVLENIIHKEKKYLLIEIIICPHTIYLSNLLPTRGSIKQLSVSKITDITFI